MIRQTDQKARERPIAAGPTAHGPEIGAMLAVSRAVAERSSLGEVLDRIAEEATHVVGAKAASIGTLSPGGKVQLAGSYRLTPGYMRVFQNWPSPMTRPSGYALKERRPVAIDDTEVDARAREWRDAARREGFRSMIAIPLLTPHAPIGTVNLYRTSAGSWDPRQVRLLEFFAEHAVSAIRTAAFLQDAEQRADALGQLVARLEAQTHENANRIHATAGMLAQGEVAEAAKFLDEVAAAHFEARVSIGHANLPAALSGLLVAEKAIAAQEGIDFTVVADDRIEFPEHIMGFQLVTMIGNLLANAFEAAGTAEPDNRLVRMEVHGAEAGITLSVQNTGSGLAYDQPAIARRGYTTKRGHSGVGLSLVTEAAAAAGGSLQVESTGQGVRAEIRLPAHSGVAGLGG